MRGFCYAAESLPGPKTMKCAPTNTTKAKAATKASKTESAHTVDRIAVNVRADLVHHIKAFTDRAGIDLEEFFDAMVEDPCKDTMKSPEWGFEGIPDVILSCWILPAKKRVAFERDARKIIRRMKAQESVA